MKRIGLIVLATVTIAAVFGFCGSPESSLFLG